MNRIENAEEIKPSLRFSVYYENGINMRHLISVLLICASPFLVSSQLYFPPVNSFEWETVSPEELGWCTENIQPLYDDLEAHNTKAFIVLKDGKIVLEKYFDSFVQDSVWYWASAAKTLTGFMVGMIESDGNIDLDAPTSQYLGAGWTTCSEEDELKIKVRDQLKMTSGLSDINNDVYCTDPECLTCLAEPGTRWAYHNAPYTLLDEVIESASGLTPNQFVFQRLRPLTGINGLFIRTGYNNVFYSTPRSFARFGLLMLNRGVWNGNDVLQNEDYFDAMTTSSQELNPSYGYLTWLNGQSGYMLPGLQFVFNGSVSPDAPVDMFSGLGKNGQYVNIVPSQNLVVIRMGNTPDEALVPVTYLNDIWKQLNEIICENVSANEVLPQGLRLMREGNELRMQWDNSTFSYQIFDLRGILIESNKNVFGEARVNLSQPGVFILRVADNNGHSYTFKEVNIQ